MGQDTRRNPVAALQSRVENAKARTEPGLATEVMSVYAVARCVNDWAA